MNWDLGWFFSSFSWLCGHAWKHRRKHKVVLVFCLHWWACFYFTGCLRGLWIPFFWGGGEGGHAISVHECTMYHLFTNFSFNWYIDMYDSFSCSFHPATKTQRLTQSWVRFYQHSYFLHDPECVHDVPKPSVCSKPTSGTWTVVADAVVVGGGGGVCFHV